MLRHGVRDVTCDAIDTTMTSLVTEGCDEEPEAPGTCQAIEIRAIYTCIYIYIYIYTHIYIYAPPHAQETLPFSGDSMS